MSSIKGTIDLACADFGGEALICSDDFFAEMSNLLKSEAAIFVEGKFTDQGKWMDGWESRRKRTPGNDWCIISLGVSGSVEAVDIDTSHFLGNHPPFGAIDVATAPADASPEELRDQVEWREVLPPSSLDPGASNLYSAAENKNTTHIRLRIFPAGGVARLRVYGRPNPPTERCNLACATSGAIALTASDQFFAHRDQLLSPSEAKHMGSGWETKRRRTPGTDWLILKLGAIGRLDTVEIDTRHFKGNYPEFASLEGILWPDASANALPEAVGWETVVDKINLGPDASHSTDELDNVGPFSHLRLTITPDGGVSRLRCFGTPVSAAGQPTDECSATPLLLFINGLTHAEAVKVLSRCCGSARWSEAMSQLRPFMSSAHLFGEAESIWWKLSEADWREAFNHHPMIGEDRDELVKKFGDTASWAAGEQAGMNEADSDLLSQLAAENRVYRERFGYIFIICASGKSASEMLSAIQKRLTVDPSWEIFTAAGEQSKITKLRLEKLTP